MLNRLEKVLRYAHGLCAATALMILAASWLNAQMPSVVDRESGLRLLVDDENTLPALRVALPGQPISKGILIIFPEHATVREHGKSEAVHLYLWQPGLQGNSPACLMMAKIIWADPAIQDWEGGSLRYPSSTGASTPEACRARSIAGKAFHRRRIGVWKSDIVPMYA